MSINKIDFNTIKSVLEKVVYSGLDLSTYKLVKWNKQNINTPAKIVNYDFIFESEEYDRWLFIRIQDFFNKQKLSIWINKLHNKQNVNIDVESYFIIKLDDKKIKSKLLFKASTEYDLEFYLNDIFKYIGGHADDNLKNVILDKNWIDIPFDWGDYK